MILAQLAELFRPRDIHVLGFTAIRSIFFRPLSLELAERNSTKTGHLLGRECHLKMHVRNVGYTLSQRYRRGAQTPPFFDDFAT